MLDPRAFLINSKTGRVVAATFIEFLSGNSTNPSICFTDSPDSGLQCDNTGAVNYIKNGINLGELGTASSLIGGSDTQIQFNNSGSFGGSADLTWDDTSKELGVGGDINLTGSISVPLGSNTSPSVYFGTDTDTGMYSPGANQVAISTSGTGRLFVDASGNVGLGTSAPTSLLTVGPGSTANPAADVTIQDSTVDQYRLKLTSNNYNVDTKWLGIGFGFNDNYLKAGILAEAKDNNARTNLHFCLDNTVTSDNAGLGDSKMVITYGGNVGIGTTSPSSVLHLKTASSPTLILDNSDSATAAIIDTWWAGTPLAFNIGSAEKARIDGSGRLLVGTSSSRDLVGASYSLQIEGSGTSPYSGLSILNKANNAVPAYLILSKSRGGTNGVDAVSDASGGDGIGDIWFAAADGTDLASASARITCFVDGAVSGDDVPGRLVFSTTADGSSSPTERMRIRANGVINFSSCPTYADDAAAGTGGLVAGDIYKTSTGELRIKL